MRAVEVRRSNYAGFLAVQAQLVLLLPVVLKPILVILFSPVLHGRTLTLEFELRNAESAGCLYQRQFKFEYLPGTEVVIKTCIELVPACVSGMHYPGIAI